MKQPLPPTPAVLRAELQRYIDEYHWPWSLVVHVVNRTYATQYTSLQLQAFYRRK